jgi:hypothetical protein
MEAAYVTPRSRDLFEKITVIQLFKKFPAFYRTIIVFTTARHPPPDPILSQLHPGHIFPPYFR